MCSWWLPSLNSVLNSSSVHSALGRSKRNLSVVDARRPVFSIMASVKVMTVRSGMGTAPRVATP